MIKPKKLKYGDTIGILAPCLSCSPEQIQAPAETLRGLGFQVRLSEHLFSNTCGFAGSIEERAADFNAMIADDSVQMLLFGGGEVSNELLPYIDYALIRSTRSSFAATATARRCSTQSILCADCPCFTVHRSARSEILPTTTGRHLKAS